VPSRARSRLTRTCAQYPIRLVLNGKASKEIEWHCKHYVGRGLMKKFNSGKELAKEMGVSTDVLKKTFDDHNKAADSKNDKFGKKVRVVLGICPPFKLTRAYSSSRTAPGRSTTYSTSRS
jgi:hypothetical protein